MNLDLSYNTEKDSIRFPEYGRGVQDLVLYAKTMEDPEKRQQTIEAVVAMMYLLNPNKGNMEDYKEKLWNHAFAIADYDLGVTPPEGVVIRRDEERPKVEHLGYPDIGSRMRHYGHNIQKLIDKAIAMEDGPKKEGFVEVIASYMKLAYKTWNREHYVSDDVVKDDLVTLSNGKLELHEGHNSLDTLAASAGKRDLQRHSQSRGKQNKNRKGGGRNYGNKNRKRKKN